MNKIGKSIKYNREMAGKTLEEIEKQTGISNENMSRWENGKVLPRIDFCVRLADYYGISIDELVGHETGRNNIINNSFNNNSGSMNVKF